MGDATILIAIPATHAEYSRRVPESDWLRKWRLEPEAFWVSRYLPEVIEPLQHLRAVAAELGIALQHKAALHDLRRATESSRIVVLIAHWKSAEVEYDDVAGVREDFLERASHHRSSLATWIYRALTSSRGKRGLSEILNESLDCRLPATRLDDSSILEDELTRRTLRRGEMDEIFEGLLQPANRLELWDGFYDKWKVEAAIHPDFRGVLDLSACNSMTLGPFLGARNEPRFRTVHYPMEVEFLWAFKCIEGAFRLAATGQFDYPEARLIATKMLDHEIRETKESSWQT
jgi:hypothetical protein